MDQTAKEKARQSALARAKAPNKNSRLSNMQGRPSNNQGNNLTFFSEDVNGLKFSPYHVMIICLVYIGLIVVLHIFGKVKNQSLGPNIPTPEPDLGDFDDPDPEPETNSGEL